MHVWSWNHVCIMDVCLCDHTLGKVNQSNVSLSLSLVLKKGCIWEWRYPGTPRIQLNGVSDANPWNLVGTQFSEKPPPKKKDILVWTVVTYCGRWTLFPSQNPRARASSRRGKMVTVTALYGLAHSEARPGKSRSSWWRFLKMIMIWLQFVQNVSRI